MLFLGAGSFRPFGIGSLEGISRLAKESVTPAVRTIIEGLESILEQYRDLPTNFRVDIEILLTVFNSLANRRDLLIAYGYPIYEKHISQDPFFTLYQYFRWKLFHEEIVIVIGYSFRDPSINSAFSDWIHSGPSSRLIIVSRPQNHKAILDILGHSSRIQFLENYFGEPGFITNLENLLVQNGSTDLAN